MTICLRVTWVSHMDVGVLGHGGLFSTELAWPLVWAALAGRCFLPCAAGMASVLQLAPGLVASGGPQPLLVCQEVGFFFETVDVVTYLLFLCCCAQVVFICDVVDYSR